VIFRSSSYLLLLLGVLVCASASSRNGGDFAPIHLTAAGLLRGSPIYNRAYQVAVFESDYPPGMLPTGMFYPPATGLAVLPFGLLPFRPAQIIWFGLTVASIVQGVRALLRSQRPEWGGHVWRFIAAAVLLCSGVRWGMTPLQGAPLMLGVLCLFCAAILGEQKRLAIALAMFALAFKFTLAVPFLAVLFLRRSFLGLAICLTLWVAANVLGMARLGGMAAFHDYRASLSLVESFHDINTPDPWEPISVPRIDLVYFVYGLVGKLPLAQIITKLVTLLVGAVLFLAALRAWKAPSARLVAPYVLASTCLGSLVVYHHHYDLVVVLAPLLLLALAPDRPKLSPGNAWLLAPLWLMLAALPIAQVHQVLTRMFGPQGGVVLNLSMPLVTLLGLGVGLRLLYAELRQPAAHEGSAV
jgi:hypothetical protein